MKRELGMMAVKEGTHATFLFEVLGIKPRAFYLISNPSTAESSMNVVAVSNHSLVGFKVYSMRWNLGLALLVTKIQRLDRSAQGKTKYYCSGKGTYQ